LGSGRATRIGILRGGLDKMLLVVGAESIGDCAWLGVINEADQSPQGGMYGAVGGQKILFGSEKGILLLGGMSHPV